LITAWFLMIDITEFLVEDIFDDWRYRFSGWWYFWWLTLQSLLLMIFLMIDITEFVVDDIFIDITELLAYDPPFYPRL
jgi:hypothetical protein